MIVRFIEATQADFNLNHGKFMVARFTPEEALTKTALPDYETESLWYCGGLRKMRPDTTLVMDLQTGEGASFSLDPGKDTPEGAALQAHFHLEKHAIWVCPMFPPFLAWLYGQGLANGTGDITALPRYVAIDTNQGDVYGFRRDPDRTKDMRRAILEALGSLHPDEGNRRESDVTHARETLANAIGLPLDAVVPA